MEPVEDTKKHRIEKKLVEHAIVSHGVLCGYYEPNLPSLQGVADELLGRFRQRYSSLAYVEGSELEMDTNTRAALFRRVNIVEKRLDYISLSFGDIRFNTILEADGALLLIQDGARVWYWLTSAPPYDVQQYTPTFMATRMAWRGAV